MRIVVDINHPGHVHFFKNLIWEMEKKGHEIMITATEKDVAIQLLDNYGFKYKLLGRNQKGLVRKILGISLFIYRMIKATKAFKPDIFLGIASYRAAQAAWLMGKKSYIFDDTEHAWGQIMMYLPFCTKVCTPSCFKRDLGKKQIRYKGYHELAYLHPKRFNPDKKVLKEMKVGKRPYYLLRFVSWGATHDIGHKGLSLEDKKRLVAFLAKHGEVFITDEGILPKELKRYRYPIEPEKIHDALYYADLYIGEGGTMASEAAVLGTPSIFINTLHMGYTDELNERYNLVFQSTDGDEIISKVKDLLAKNDLKKKSIGKRSKLLKDKIDLTGWMIEFIQEQK